MACKKNQEVLNRPLRSRRRERQGNILESRERADFQKDVSPLSGWCHFAVRREAFCLPHLSSGRKKFFMVSFEPLAKRAVHILSAWVAGKARVRLCPCLSQACQVQQSAFRGTWRNKNGFWSSDADRHSFALRL